MTVTITKIKDGAIAQGFYTIDFTVDVNMNKLQPGDAAQNKISESNVVYVRRDAELTVNKTWRRATERGENSYLPAHWAER